MQERAPEPADDQRLPSMPDGDSGETGARLDTATATRAHGRSTARRAGLYSGRTATALVSVAVLAATGYGWWTVGGANDNVVTTDVIDQKVTEQHGKPLDGAVDILLVGMDSRTDAYGNPLPDEEMATLHAGISDGERNTDTMILVHIPIDGTRATAISFPRDSWVEQAGPYGKHKLNSAFVYAYNDTRKTLVNQGVQDRKELDNKATVAGRKNLIATIEKLTGNTVSIDKYAEVNLASFYEITKAIPGGVQVCLNKAVNDSKSGAHFKAGVQTVSGASALSFVRQRYGLPNGDLDRIVRQQVFLGALANKVLSADMLTNPTALRDLLDAVKKSVVLSSNWDLVTFAEQMQGLTSGNIQFRTIPTEGNANIGGADVIKVDPAKVKAFVGALTSDERTPAAGQGSATPSTHTPATMAAGAITVAVRNGSHQRGLAAQVSNELVANGFQDGGIGDAPVQTTTTVQYAPGELAAAQQVVAQLGGAASTAEDAALSSGHVTVILGTDRQTARNGIAASGNLDLAPPPGSAGQGSNQPGGPSPSVPGSGPTIQAGGITCVN